MQLRASGDKEANMSVLLALNCAPLIKKSSMANILTVTFSEFAGIGRLLQGTDITYRFWRVDGRKALLYLYREKELADYLGREDVRAFLKDYGYCEGTLQKDLHRLSERVRLYNDGEAQFPHEIGVFLGYPLPDVKGFISNSGQNFAYLGYWKVYHNVQEAMKLFRKYDEARELAVREITLGKTIREIAV